MTISKVERLLNLVICLLSTRQFVSADYIRRSVAGYSGTEQTDEAFFRMFERDKTELRDLGVPLVTGSSVSGVDGYRIDRDSYELPDITLDRPEAAAIALAAALWDTPEISSITQSAVLKLRAAGFDVRTDDDLGFTPENAMRSLGSGAVFNTLFEAIDARRAVTFTYRAGAAAAPTERSFEPWGVATHRSRWYVTGRDRDRQAQRTFRLDRISDVRVSGQAGNVEVPDELDLQASVAAAVDSTAGSDGRKAHIWVAADRAAGLRRLAAHSTPGAHQGEAGDVLTIDIRSESTLTRMVLGAGADAVVLDPPELRSSVIDSLNILAGGRR